jgi:hypothetical protein
MKRIPGGVFINFAGKSLQSLIHTQKERYGRENGSLFKTHD